MTRKQLIALGVDPALLDGVPAASKAKIPGGLSLLPPGPRGEWRVVIERWRPPYLNAFITLNRYAQAKIKKGAYATIAAHCLQAGVTKAQGKRHLSLTLGFDKIQNLPDNDGVWKALLDGLSGRSGCGALVDDSPAWVEYDRYEPDFTGKRTIITIRDMF